MSDKEQRALAAGRHIQVKDKKYLLRPIAVQQLVDLEGEALEYYKRNYIKTFSANADLLGDDARAYVREKADEAARWGLDDLPKKTVYGVDSLPITEPLKKWAKEFLERIGDDEDEEELTQERIRAILSVALDREQVKPPEVKALTGKSPKEGRARYDQWWVTGPMEGMVAFIYTSIRYEHKEVTRQDILDWPLGAIFEGAKKVEQITAPQLGNG